MKTTTLLALAILPLACTAFAAETVSVLKTGDEVYVRSSFSSRNDVVIQIGDGENGQITFRKAGLVSVEKPMDLESCRGMFVFHATPDESAPWKVNGTYIGAGHGWSGGVLELTLPDHGVEEAQLGGLWKDAEGRSFYLLKIVDRERLWLIPENHGSAVRWNFETRFQSPFLDDLGRSHDTAQIRRVQLHPSLRTTRKSYQMNGDTPLREGEVMQGSFLQVTDEHDIINPASVLEHVKAAPGGKLDLVGPQLAALISNQITYRFEPRGLCAVRQVSTVHQDLALETMGVVQTHPLVCREGDTLRMLIPGTRAFEVNGTSYDFATGADMTLPPPVPLLFGETQGNLASPGRLPHRFIQFLETTRVREPVIGFAVGYSLLEGITMPEQRAANCQLAGFIHTSSKVYPVAIDSKMGPLHAGTVIDATAYRQYFSPREASDHATALYWHPSAGAWVLYADYHSAVVDEVIRLPETLVGATVDVLEATPSVTLHSGENVPPEGLRLSVNGEQGSLILKLSPKP